MEEPVGAQYAIQVALQTLKERCRNLQEMVTNLEEENLRLRGQLSQTEHNSVSVSDFDKLKAQVAELSENKLQLLNKIKMVTSENQELWSKLSRLSQVNHNLGTQLSKINDSLVQYTTKNKEHTHTPLIRSKTFTQDEPHTKVLQKNIEENGKICAELEEISLKIINSFAQEKNELDSLYSGIRDVHWGDNIITESCGFYFEEYDNDIIDNLNTVLDDLKAAKETANNQKVALQLALKKLHNLNETKKKKVCDKINKKVEMIDKCITTVVLSDSKESREISIPEGLSDLNNDDPVEAMDMICPMCCRNFNSNTDFQIFQEHVEKHFVDEHFEVL